MINISLLTKSHEESYTDMLHHCRGVMFSHSIPYRNLLASFLDCEPYYIVAIGGRGDVIGAIPSFLKKNSRLGNVLNSLPFFGSHGGVLVHSGLHLDEQVEVKMLLLGEFNILAKEKNCVLSAISTSPFDPDISAYENNLSYRFKEERTAQIVEFRGGVADVEQEIMHHIIDPDNRRAIRRPLKNSITSEVSRDFSPLFEMHSQNISSKGGNVKPLEFFQKVQELIPEEDYSLTYAKKDGEIIAGLLVFLFGDTVEYYTPALQYEHSVEQGTSLLIYEEMKRAIRNGYRYWNFGGTLKNQPGLHKFKAQWGAKDYPYYYYVTRYRDIDHILKMEPRDILGEYRWFYVVPFGILKSASRIGVT